jgi:hypothetical protein
MKFGAMSRRGREAEITARDHSRGSAVALELLGLPLFRARIDLFG